MKNKYQAKILAEQHYFFNKSLNMTEYKLVAESKYRKFLKTKPSSLIDFITESNNSSQSYKTQEVINENVFSRLNEYEKADLRLLIHAVEEEFNIGMLDPISNEMNLDVNKVRSFIKSIAKEENLDTNLNIVLSNALRQTSASRIMNVLNASAV